MNILFVSHSSEIGGAEQVLLNLINELDKHGIRSLVALPGPGPLEKRLRAKDIDCFQTELKWWLIPGNRDSNQGFLDFCDGIKDRVARLTEVIASRSIDLVVTNTSAIPEGALAAKMTGVPHVWYIHELLGGKGGLQTPAAKKLFFSVVSFLSRSIVVVSQSVYDDLQESGGIEAPVEIIYNGVEINPEPGERKYLKDKKIIAVGSIYEGKGILTLLHAAREVCDQKAEAVFFVAGKVMDPLHYQYLLQERACLGLEEKFVFLGFREDIPELLRQSDLFVLPSLRESFSMVVLEAMNAALPVVATRSGGSEEMIVEGENGFLVEVNDPSMMADRILFLLNHELQARAMGEKGCTTVKQNFSLDQFGRNFIRFLEKVSLGKVVESPHSRERLIELIDFFDGLGQGKRQIVEKKQEQIRQLEERHRQLEERHQQEIRGIIADFTSSHSWRLTKPLRWVSKKIKREVRPQNNSY